MTLPRSFVRPLVRPMVRSGAVGPYGGATYQDGIHLNFASGNTTSGYYVKAVGAAPTVSPLTSLFTFTGGNQSMYMGPDGLLVASATNTPRIEYDATGNCLGLLMEAARTNLSLYSQSAGAAYTTVAEVTVTGNAGIAPDGTTTATLLTESTTAAAQHQWGQTPTWAATTTYTFSWFIKPNGRTWVQLRLSGAFGALCTAYFNLSGSGSVGTVSNFTTTSIQAYPNGWYRIRGTATSGAAPAGAIALIRLANANGGETYTGDGVSGMYVWGHQVEAGAFPSSYIPTTTGSVARTADSCSRTLGSEFSATAGTVVLAGRTSGGQDAGAGQTIIEFDDATSNERHTITRAATSDTVRYNVFDGGVLQSSMDSASLTNTTAFKSAWAWALNDIAQSTNGGVVNTDTGATLPTVTQLVLGGPGGNGNSFMNGHILRFDYWPERKANAFLVSAST